MLYKPYSGQPNLETVSIEDNINKIDFTVAGMNSSEISSVGRLNFNGALSSETLEKCDDNRHFYKNIEVYNSTVKNGYQTKAVVSTDIFLKNVPISWNLRLYENSSYIDNIKDNTDDYIFIKDETDDRKSSINFDNLWADITSSDTHHGDFYICKNYVPNSWVGYGSIEQTYLKYLCKDTDTKNYYWSSSSKYSVNLKNRDAYSNGLQLLKIFPHTFTNSHIWGFNGDTSNFRKAFDKYKSGYDEYYARYYIKINGIYYKILDWRYYDWFFASYDKEKEKNNTPEKMLEGEVDGYGNPLAMYVLIYAPDAEIRADTEYTIYSNYMDSNNYTFQINDVPSVKFYDTKFPSSNITFYSTKEEAIGNPFILEYSNLELNGRYSQNSGAYISQYQVELLLDDGTAIDKTKSFSQTLQFCFSDFSNANKYLLHISIINNRNVIDERYLYITPSYNTTSNLINADVKYNRKHNSAIIDFSKLHSITPTISDDGYEFDNENKSVKIFEGNSLTYDKNDDFKTPLNIQDSLVNFTFKLKTGFNGEICKVIEDNGTETCLSWNSSEGVFRCDIGSVSCSVLIYGEWELETQLAAMQNAELNSNTEYNWGEEFNEMDYNENLYFHAETKADMYWCSAIIDLKEKKVYIKIMSEEPKWYGGV